MKKSPPTKEELKMAFNVLKFYEKQASNLVTITEQEYPSEIARGLEIWMELLSGDPGEYMKSYLDEYKAGHSIES